MLRDHERGRTLLSLVGATLIAASAAAAQKPNPPPTTTAGSGEKEYRFSGWLQTGFTANFDSPDDRIRSRAGTNLSVFFRNSYSRVSAPLGPSTDKLNPVMLSGKGVKKQMSSITLVRPERERLGEQKEGGARDRRRLPPAICVALGWAGAALGIYAVELGAHGPFSGLPCAVVALVKIALIVGAGGLYARVVRGAPSDLVLATGVAWLTFSIAADVVTGIRSAGAYQLLGDPLAPQRLRDLTMLAWLVAPALFARRAGGSDRTNQFRLQR
jgi:hypothetical protein